MYLGNGKKMHVYIATISLDRTMKCFEYVEVTCNYSKTASPKINLTFASQ